MNNEEKKYRYKNILYQLKNVNRKIEQLNSDVLGLKEVASKTIIINNQTYNEERIENINKILTNTKSIINETIIPSIINKIYN